jgi:hypothetical protein
MAYVALHSVLKPGREADYDLLHQQIPDDLLEAHRRAGITDWSIWRGGRDLFHLVERDDFPAALLRRLYHWRDHLLAGDVTAVAVVIRPYDELRWKPVKVQRVTGPAAGGDSRGDSPRSSSGNSLI